MYLCVFLNSDINSHVSQWDAIEFNNHHLKGDNMLTLMSTYFISCNFRNCYQSLYSDIRWKRYCSYFIFRFKFVLETGSQLKLPNDFNFSICFYLCPHNLYLILASCNQWCSMKWYVVIIVQLCSVAKSCPTLRPHGLQHAKLLCPPLSHRVWSNSCLSRQWCFRVLDSVGEGEGGMIWENGIETCILSYVKRITSPGSMHETGCSRLVHWDDPEEWDEREVGEGFRMGSHSIQHCKVICHQLK